MDRLWQPVSKIMFGIAALERRFRNSRRGSVAITIGLTLPIVIGTAALGSEITYLLYKHRQMQVVADAAALGGATALQRGYPAAGVEARGISGFLGFVDGSASGVTVTVNNPPLSGSQINNRAAVEVIVGQPQTLVMVSFVSQRTLQPQRPCGGDRRQRHVSASCSSTAPTARASP